jgi:hypothetical protein
LHQVFPFTALTVSLSLNDTAGQQAPLDIQYREFVILHRFQAVHGQNVLAPAQQLPHPLEDASEHRHLLLCRRVSA